jgi:DNA (cytosine-5)-methyltransferase 1
LKNKYKVGGLFSGVGGIEMGFEQAGFSIEWANEFDKYACKTYRSNFNHQLFEKDIHNLKGDELSNVNVLTGGFPCQAFSVAGYRKGFNDERGNLFFQIMRLIDEMDHKPEVLFLENVKNFKGHDRGRTFEIVCKEIAERGYSVFHDVLNTAKYTLIPQNRERIFIICFKNEHDWQLKPINSTISSRFSALFPPKLKNKPKNIRDFLEKRTVDRKFFYDEDKYMYKELKENMTNIDTVYQWRRKYVRENKSNLCSTLTANMGTGGHNVPLIIDDSKRFRKLTPRECFNLQGFGKNFKIPSEISNGNLYKQAGNAVTVPLIKILAKQIKIALDG